MGRSASMTRSLKQIRGIANNCHFPVKKGWSPHVQLLKAGASGRRSSGWCPCADGLCFSIAPGTGLGASAYLHCS